MSRPDLCEKGKTLFVGLVPPAPGGASIVARNLLDCFTRESIVVATAENRDRSAMEYEWQNETHEILKSFGYSRRINNWLFRIQVPRAAKQLARIAKEIDAKVIVGSHPISHLLETVRLASKEARIPWIAYLHDTLAEATSHLADEARLKKLQADVFAEASHIAVMSEGMADLYRNKYDGFETTPLEHIYPLDVRDVLPKPPSHRKILWAGNVYGINARSFGRAVRAAKMTDIHISMTTAKQLSVLEGMGIDISSLDRVYYPEWSDYLEALNEHEILLLALDWPDESPIHHDELATIFPTKTPEYLASGRPILVHCPEDYFLARFFRNHDCGTIVSERSIDALANAISTIRQGGAEIRRKSEHGLSAMGRFMPDRVAGRLKSLVDAASTVKWGEKVAIDLTDA